VTSQGNIERVMMKLKKPKGLEKFRRKNLEDRKLSMNLEFAKKRVKSYFEDMA